MATALARDQSVIILARAAPFRLGDLDINPATREVSRGGESEIVEPRVMQVLVALAEARGAVVARDELVTRCWDGRIVGDNAITRVIAQIRRLASEFGQNAFELETITKVGYRLKVADGHGLEPAEADLPPAPEPPHPSRPERRRFLAAASAALGLGAVGWFGWTRYNRHVPPPEAADLFRRGEQAQRAGEPGQTRQAVAYLEQAVRIDPLYAEAWGALALAYRHILEGFGEAEKASLAARLRSAANRALALDPDNGDARLALVIVDPFYGRWSQAERDLRGVLAEHPRQWLVNGQLGQLLNEVGRLEEALPFLRRQIELDPMLPIGHMFYARGLSLAGRLQEAEAAHDVAQQRWPANPALYFTRYSFLLFNDRPGAAAAFISNPDSRPAGIPDEAFDGRLRIARAFESRDPGLLRQVVAEARAEAEADPLNHQFATAILAMVGLHDDVFRILDRYFFESPVARYERRYTYSLFAPPLRQLRRDPRFASLVDRLGLERYWRQSGTTPDYRRG